MNIAQHLLCSASAICAAFLIGCASTKSSSSDSDKASYHHDQDLQQVWLADQFDFNGYDTLYIADTKLEAKPHNNEEIQLLEWAKPFLRDELAAMIRATNVFGKVATSEAAIKPGGKTLRLENTIIEYQKGGGGARYFAGPFGGGQPVIKVRGKMTDGDKNVFLFESRRSGESVGARMGGVFKSDKEIQTEDIHDLAIDMAGFISQTSKHIARK